jgi:hypothetical protein
LQLLLDEKYVFFCNTFLKKPRLEQWIWFTQKCFSYFYKLTYKILQSIWLNPDDNRVQGPNEFAKITYQAELSIGENAIPNLDSFIIPG